MTFVTVRVSMPLNRLIYINGDYSQSAGNSSTDSFTVPTGGQIFETLNGNQLVDNRKRTRSVECGGQRRLMDHTVEKLARLEFAEGLSWRAAMNRQPSKRPNVCPSKSFDPNRRS